MAAASSTSLTTSLERHGNHVGSAVLLVVGGVLPLVIAVAVLLLLMQG
jgi:hypothetical protein